MSMHNSWEESWFPELQSENYKDAILDTGESMSTYFRPKNLKNLVVAVTNLRFMMTQPHV